MVTTVHFHDDLDT